jgi:hypothetical protein
MCSSPALILILLSFIDHMLRADLPDSAVWTVYLIPLNTWKKAVWECILVAAFLVPAGLFVVNIPSILR